MTPVLQVSGLSVRYPRRSRRDIASRGIEDVSFAIAPGEIVGLIGESGSGKSTLAHAILRLTPAYSGEIILQGEAVHGLSGRMLRRRRQAMQMVFQNPLDSLNPRMSIRHSLEESLLTGVHKLSSRSERDRRIAEALIRVGLPLTATQGFPHQFSGGQLQRIAIARALISRPRLLICDEAVSALDLSIQAQIVNLLADIREELGMAIFFISHDLAVVRQLCDRLLVLYNGRIIESERTDVFFSGPRHPYSQTLLQSAHGPP